LSVRTNGTVQPLRRFHFIDTWVNQSQQPQTPLII